eukprot:6178505-Pleurochrysis_carterae.AAC.3
MALTLSANGACACSVDADAHADSIERSCVAATSDSQLESADAAVPACAAAMAVAVANEVVAEEKTMEPVAELVAAP